MRNPVSVVPPSLVKTTEINEPLNVNSLSSQISRRDPVRYVHSSKSLLKSLTP